MQLPKTSKYKTINFFNYLFFASILVYVPFIIYRLNYSVEKELVVLVIDWILNTLIFFFPVFAVLIQTLIFSKSEYVISNRDKKFFDNPTNRKIKFQKIITNTALTLFCIFLIIYLLLAAYLIYLSYGID